jgi:hypothetical protein
VLVGKHLTPRTLSVELHQIPQGYKRLIYIIHAKSTEMNNIVRDIVSFEYGRIIDKVCEYDSRGLVAGKEFEL